MTAVFVTGGVVSNLGKGITSACLGAILESRGLSISMIKLDPYINVDPGTMSPSNMERYLLHLMELRLILILVVLGVLLELKQAGTVILHCWKDL